MTDVAKMMKLHRNWMIPGVEEFHQQLHEDLKTQLAEDSLSGLGTASDLLGMLATYQGIRGLIAVDDGVETGWRDLANAILYRYWALRLRARSFSKTCFLRGIQYIPGLTNEMGNAGCLLAGFIATDRADLAATIADLLLGMMTVDGAVDARYREQRRFEPFMLWLYSKYSGDSDYAEIGAGDLGIYRRLVDSWDNTGEFASALAEVCVYHLANNDDTGGDWDPEFKNAPFDLLPLEIRAIEVVRQQQGLSTPGVKHPLLTAPSAVVEKLEWRGDETVIEVEAAYHRFFDFNTADPTD